MSALLVPGESGRNWCCRARLVLDAVRRGALSGVVPGKCRDTSSDALLCDPVAAAMAATPPRRAVAPMAAGAKSAYFPAVANLGVEADAPTPSSPLSILARFCGSSRGASRNEGWRNLGVSIWGLSLVVPPWYESGDLLTASSTLCAGVCGWNCCCCCCVRAP